MKKQFNKTILGSALLAATLLLSGCYSVFSGGTGGIIVDAESTSTPKAGIPFVDVYAYTDSGTRDAAYNSWREGTIFSPSNAYYGHTTTDINGNFTISNIVWKSEKPEFGKDADFTTIYLLYYHENYGLTKGSTVITSDSTSDTVYAELRAIKKTTALTINIYDVANTNLTSNNILVKVSVPQTTDTLTNAKPKIYEQNITGSGTINISYPRWKNAEDKATGIENKPDISITYAQSADTITWKACANADNEAQNYAFYDDDFSITKKIRNEAYDILLYGKATRINSPTINGTYISESGNAADGKLVKMMTKDADGNYTIFCDETSTDVETHGQSGTQTHGKFSGLGNNYFWIDTSYTDKFSTKDVQISIGEHTTNLTLHSNKSSYSINL